MPLWFPNRLWQPDTPAQERPVRAAEFGRVGLEKLRGGRLAGGQVALGESRDGGVEPLLGGAVGVVAAGEAADVAIEVGADVIQLVYHGLQPLAVWKIAEARHEEVDQVE